MKLHYKVSGEGEPLVILHGLFGTLENWGGQVRTLSEHFRVFALDLRNHGRSPWSERMDYPAMADDVLEFLDDQGLEQVAVLGHSMGGKVAMQLALAHPGRVARLIVADIAPVVYPPRHMEVFDGLFSVPLATLQSRGEAEERLKAHVTDPGVRQFLLKNLYREEGKFAWRVNLKVLQREYEHIAAAPEAPRAQGCYKGPTLFIKGGASEYIQETHRPAIEALFPAARARIMAGVGHWPHAEKPALFTQLVLKFLQSA
ncbi:alpha/beta fold hydrolase [Motiliproteus sp. SC1-56]|uniref:alpha/beta fold hydrolase n=1 Tax=Motiliproteus sp. SC1-56 TaxID=2799565 RepID=UPI001A8F22EC|nr:alpha/beta fold hydrolase [Motiliproteus sp. SC1-56]